MKTAPILIHLIAFLALFTSCSKDTPTQDQTPIARARDTIVVLPAATATIRWFPEMDSIGLPPFGDDIQASYFRTTATNREIRRGFAEFNLPTISDSLISAVLTFKDDHAVVSDPRSADGYLVSFYAADSTLDTLDFKTVMETLDTISVDANDEQKTYCLNIMTKTQAYAGQRVGIRFCLNGDFQITDSIPRGSGFGSLLNLQPTITVITQK